MSERVTVTYEGFIETFPEFACTEAYPEVTVTAYLEHAQCFISTRNGARLKNKCRVYAIYLILAHLLTLRNMIAEASNSGTSQIGFETHATIGDVSVSMEAPRGTTAFQEWLGLTGYGRELRALLSSRGAVPALISTATPYRVFQ